LVSLGDPVNKGSSKYVFMGGTLTGNPVSSAAGLATLEILQRSSPYAAVNQLAGGFADGIRDAAVCAGVHLHVTQVGSIIQLYFGDIGLVKNAGDAARADLGAGKTFAKLLLERGIFTVPNAKFYVSVAHSSEDIDQTLESVRFVLKRM
jgi:glutamate-1-semialdehyde 2,1-aminomutase